MKKILLGLVIVGFLMPPSVLAVAPGCVTEVKTLTVFDWLGPLADFVPGRTAGTGVPSLACLADTVASAIKAGLILLGAMTLLYLLFGAIKFATSRGDQKAVQSAKGTMTYAILAALLVLGAYALVSFFTQTLGLPNILNTFTFYK